MTFRFWTTLVLLSAVLGYSALNNAGAGIDPPDWHWSMLFVGLLGCFHFGIRPADPPGIDRFTLVAAGLFLLIATVQIIPLPTGVVHLLSPARVELLQLSLPFTHASPNFLTLSVVPYQTAEHLITLVGYAIVALIVRDLTLGITTSPWITSFPILILGVLEAVLGFVQVSMETADGSVAAGTFPNRDHFAGLLEMIIPFAAMIPISILRRDHADHEYGPISVVKACIFLGITAILLVAVIYSLSRMGFIAALAGLFVAGSIAVSLRGFSTYYEVSANWFRRWSPSLIVGLVVLAGFIVLPTDPLLARFSDLARTDDVPPDTRLQIWRDTAGLVKAFPLFGCGLGGYYSCLLKYKTAAPMNTVDYAHNDYLQVLAEMGVAGFLAGAMFVFRVLQRAIRGARYAQSIDTRYVAIACAGSMTAMLLHSIVDFNMYVPINGLVFAWILGIAGIFLVPSPRRKGYRLIPRYA